MIKRHKANGRARYEDMEVKEWILGHCGSYARRRPSEQMESDKTDARLLIVKMSRLLTRILSLYELAYDDVHDARIFIEDAQKYEFEE